MLVGAWGGHAATEVAFENSFHSGKRGFEPGEQLPLRFLVSLPQGLVRLFPSVARVESCGSSWHEVAGGLALGGPTKQLVNVIMIIMMLTYQ